ncbi:o-succinylbenzoate synthase [Opitutus terrae]|uniref:o-succinylbenzoate synthase n=1 Tax=Opitutus terrae (strain DSM 11246 / JCM 15787 / PB90-1) TaxID=452637 RepID=B1ZW04_OPITP|nr:o-succinylbenzoate synthase [Opitutus terrae]ACB76087.1 Mandelate racemase/muconate lactonizing protein [Opitutus terrae PB90-1]
MRLGFAYRRYRLRFRAPVRTAHGVWTEREGVWVRLCDEAGHAGYGEAAPIPWFGTETIGQTEAVARAIGPKLDANDEESLADAAVEAPCLVNALRSAWHGLQEESRRTTGHASAATQADDPTEFRSVAALLPAGRAALGVITEKAEAGFRVFKWKVGVANVGDELVLLDDVCAALPDGAKLRLDANGAWDRRQAERWLERCAERPIEFVEQPCLAAAAEAPAQRRKIEDTLRGLAEDYPTPIALDESLVVDGDVARWLAEGWRGVFVLKPALLAAPWTAVAKLAAAKASVVFSSALETIVGARAALHLAFTWPGERKALGFGVWPLFAESRCDGPTAAPFLRWSDVKRLDPARAWAALEEKAS